MHGKDSFSTTNVGFIQHDTAIKASRAQKCRVKHVGPVGGCDDDDIGMFIKTIHLDEQLVQSLLSLIIAAHPGIITLATNGIDLVNKHNAGSMLFGLFEEVAHACCTNTHKHLYKF